MNQQGRFMISKADILDLSGLASGESSMLNCHSNSWHGSLVKQNRLAAAAVSEEELKIRSELEMDVERDLEQEIKDGIYHLALRLHRLYQQQKERKNKKNLLEVNISIRMEGGTKVEIKETKKEHPEKGRPRTSSRSENMQVMLVPNTKKFDWAKTLRSNAGPVVITKQIGSSNQARIWKN